MMPLPLPPPPNLCRILDLDAIRYIVAHGMLAPSGANMQPWLFRFDGETLTLRTDPTVRFEAMDFRSIALWISCGAVVENIEMAAHTLGLRPQIASFPDSSSDHAVCNIAFTPQEPYRPELFDWIGQRVTNRRIPRERELLAPKLAESMIAIAVNGHTCLQICEDPESLARYEKLLGAENRISWLNEDIYNEFVGMFRWTAADAISTSDGIDVDTLDVSSEQRARLAKLAVRSNVEALRASGGERALEQAAVGRISRSSALALLTIPSFEGRAILDAGRVVQRLWLTATAAGWCVQPLTSLPYFFMHAERGAGQLFSEQELAELRDMRARYKRIFKVSEGDAEVFMFRLARGTPASVRGLRHPVERHLKF